MGIMELFFDNWGRLVSTGQGRSVVARRGVRWPRKTTYKNTNANDETIAGRIGFAPACDSLPNLIR